LISEVCGVVTADWSKKTSDVPEGLRRQWRADRALRPAMRSPGRPDPSRVVQRQFWRLIATGVTTVEASLAVGVSWPVGTRWFRHAGGMSPISLAEPTGRYLSFEEREEIAIQRAKGAGVRQIARALGRDPGTISRELRRNAATRGGNQEYRATVAQWKAQQAAKRPKVAKLVTNDRLREYVQERLDGTVRGADGTVVAGPGAAEWKGRKMKPHRADRRWATAWSPQQISHRVRLEFPDDESMRISHEAIYQALFIQGRGALKRELVACLRTGRALREPRARTRNKPQGHVTADVVLSERPAEAADRAVPGHWEGDLIIGTGRSAIGTLVERASRSTLLVHLPRLEGWGEKPPVKNGLSLGGYGAVAMNAALTASMAQLPEQLRKTLTWDRGKELSGHAQFALDTGTKVYFADPHSPWQRPTNENTNGLLRQYFPKGTDLSRWSAEDLEAVALAINNRPRKVLGWKTPAEVLEEQLRSLQQPGVASTG
jgi:IS30 family transposase